MSDDVWTLIANPVSGRGRARRVVPRLAQMLKDRGVDASILWTSRPGDGNALARQAVDQGAARIVACGGDGTVHEVVNGLMAGSAPERSVGLGVLPMGRCNDLATTLRLPRALPAVVETLLQGTLRSIDLGRIGDQYFSTVATLGFDSAVNQYVLNGSSPFFRRGTIAYLYGVFANLFRYRDVWVRMRGDFGEFQGHIFLAATGNTPNYAGRLKIAPSAVVDDGVLNTCLVRSVSRWEVLRMLPRIFSGGHVSHPAVSLEPIRRLEIESREPLWIFADGERITQTPATIEVVPRALSVLVPPGSFTSA